MKKFYETASVEKQGKGFAILLDGRPVKTPAKAALEVPSLALAEAIAKEWREQGDRIKPESMAMTGLANAMIDRIATDPATTVAEMVRYLGTDLICYRAEDDPLKSKQDEIWGPYQKWFEGELGCPLAVTTGIMPVEQSDALLTAFEEQVATLDPLSLTALKEMVGLLGSAVLGFAGLKGFKDPVALWHASDLDRLHQADNWGQDPEAEADIEVKRASFEDAHRFFSLRE